MESEIRKILEGCNSEDWIWDGEDERRVERFNMEAAISELTAFFESDQQGVHPTVLNVREIEVVCPQCQNKFSFSLPASHSG